MDTLLSMLKAFAVGGALCVIAQVLIDETSITPARILVIYVVSGVVLGALGLYQPLIDFAGRGAAVPLSGFGANIAKGMRAAIDEKGAAGIITGALTAASGGTCAALIFGLAASVIFKGKPK